jgi:hypothetical protein
MKKLITITILSILFLSKTYSQQGMWVQTASTPEGSGVTDMVIRQSNQHIFVTTGSFNWPNGDMGGVRRSIDDGTTWENLWDVYIARTIIEGADENLYASIWPYPQNEGLYRSTDDGNTWGNPLVTVPSGDNIFSVAINPTTSTQTIFAGTRNGIQRSLDNGSTFSAANNGIPSNSWVRDVEVDSNGIVAAATTNGLFISTDNGDMWQQAAGIVSGETISKLLFDYNPLTERSGTGLYAGTSNGKLYVTNDETFYLNCAIVYTFFSGTEIAGIVKMFLQSLNNGNIIIARYPNGTSGGGVSSSSDNGATWRQENEGLPNNPKTSAMMIIPFSGGSKQNDFTNITLFVGLYENTNGGAKVYKRDFVVSVEKEDNQIPTNYVLGQNYPNPFNPSTTISFSLPEETFVKLEVYNSIGEKISTLASENLIAGNYKYDWNAKSLPSGIYLYRLQTDSFTESKKMILMK